MSASPFRVSPSVTIETPIPVIPSAGLDNRKSLEDVPFSADIHHFPALEEESRPRKNWTKESQKSMFRWVQNLIAGREERRLRELKLAAELQDLRASYASLLHSTEDIRERFDLETESRHRVAKALSPFPAAIAGIERLQTRQEEASEILLSIRERITTTADRDARLVSSLDTVQDQVKGISTGVDSVAKVMTQLAEGQTVTATTVGEMGGRIEARFEEAADLARKNAERVEQSSDDVLQVLRQMERNSQRGLWIFATLLALLFFGLLFFSAKIGQLGVSPLPAKELVPAAEESAISLSTSAPDEFQF